MSKLEATDRYGGNYPDPTTVCPGECEGMGTYPEEVDGKWVFLKCPDCNGTGKVNGLVPTESLANTGSSNSPTEATQERKDI